MMFETLRDALIALFSAACKLLPGVMLETTKLASIGSIAYGAWLLHPSAGFISGGALVLAGLIFSPKPRTA